jgi:hypothetical protein
MEKPLCLPKQTKGIFKNSSVKRFPEGKGLELYACTETSTVAQIVGVSTSNF